MRARVWSGRKGWVWSFALLPLLLGFSEPAGAGVAYFRDGGSLAIEAAWMHDGMIVFRLPGGGVIGTDPARLARVHLDSPALPPFTEPALPEVASAAAPLVNAPDLGVLVRAAAERHKLDEALLRAVVQAESAFNPQAISAVGAVGLMQLMPGTARELAVEDPLDPEQNLEGGARYLRWLLDLFPGRTELALAAYNAGPGAVMRFGGIPPYRETRSYVARVLALARP